MTIPAEVSIGCGLVQVGVRPDDQTGIWPRNKVTDSVLSDEVNIGITCPQGRGVSSDVQKRLV